LLFDITFDVAIGHASDRGPRIENQDFVASQRVAPHEEEMGFVTAIADGVSAGLGAHRRLVHHRCDPCPIA